MTTREIRALFERGVEDVVEVDLVEAARQGAARARRRRMTVAATSVVGVAAAALLAVTVWGGWAGGGNTTAPEPAETGVEDGAEAPAPSGASFVFQRAGTVLPDELVTTPPPDSSPPDVDLAGAWDLTGWLVDGRLAPAGPVVGVEHPTRLLLSGEQSRGLQWRLEADCGYLFGGTPLVLSDHGAFPAFSADTIGHSAGGCPEGVGIAHSFWAETLPHGGRLVAIGENTLLVEVEPVEATSTPMTALQEPVPLGAGLTVTALPDGWQLLHRGQLDGDAMESCVVADGLPGDPTGRCEVVLTAGRATAHPWGPLAGLGENLECWADPREALRSPQANLAEIDPDSVQRARYQHSSGVEVAVERALARCADGGEFSPQVWWSEELGITVQDRGGRLDVYSLLDAVVEDPGAKLGTTDARVEAVTDNTIGLQSYRPGDGPVGTGEPGGRASYEISDATRCLLHDTMREPGHELRPVGCQELVGWLAEHVEERPHVTVITRGAELLQVRTLYLP